MSISEPHAKKRIKAMVLQAKANARATGADPAETMFELLTAAAVISQAMQPKGTVEGALSSVLPFAAACAADWFPPTAKH